jgi:hypothetical protein
LIEKGEVVKYSQMGAFYYMEWFGNAEKVIANYLVFRAGLQMALSLRTEMVCKKIIVD